MTTDLKIAYLRINEGSSNHEVTVTLKPTYSDERRYRMARDSVVALQADLDRLGTGKKLEIPENQKQITVKAPKKWMIGSGLPKHPVVFLIFDPQTPSQTGYALGADAALKMAEELTKQAKALQAHPTPARQ